MRAFKLLNTVQVQLFGETLWHSSVELLGCDGRPYALHLESAVFPVKQLNSSFDNK